MILSVTHTRNSRHDRNLEQRCANLGPWLPEPILEEEEIEDVDGIRRRGCRIGGGPFVLVYVHVEE